MSKKMKPEVICHIMGSVDGRLLPQRWSAPFGDAAPGELFSDYAAIGRELSADAWMFGKATTCEMFPERYVAESARPTQSGRVHKGHRDSRRLFITVDPEADILYTSDRLRGDNILTVLGTNASADYLSFLEKTGISYIVLDDPTDLAAAMTVFAEDFGIKRISLQGGGIINGAMLASGLLDELSLVIYPGIDGNSAAPSIFEFIGSEDDRPASGQTLELISSDVRKHGIVWLRYKIHRGANSLHR